MPPDQARSQNQTTGPNGLIERQVTKELLDLFDINEQTLNTEGLQITTTIDPKAQEAAEEAVVEYLDGQDPDMRTAVVSIDPRTGGVKAYYGGTDANGFDFAQAGLPTGSSFKVFALVAALQQGMGLGYQVDSSPVTVNGIKITNVEGGGCGTCNIAEALKRSLNTSYYRLMLKLKNGPQDVADAAHQAGIAESFPGVEHTLSEDGKGGPPNNGIVLGQYQTRVLDMASAYATLAASGMYHEPHFVQKVVNAQGQVLFDASTQDNTGEQRIDKAVADNVTSAMQPIAGYSNGHNLAGGRPSAAKTGTNQLGDTGDNRDAWMVGYTPSLSTAVWVGTTEGTKPLENKWGSPVYGSGLPSDIWKSTMDGALEDTDNESFPKPTEIGGYAGVPQAPPPPPSPVRRRRRRRRSSSRPSKWRRASRSRSARRRRCPPVHRPGPRRSPPASRHRSGRARSPGAAAASAPVTARRQRRRDERAAREPVRATVSPQPLAADLRSADDRDLPSRTDTIGAALSQVIGGPVGRHALIGRTRFLTPLRVMLIIALVFLALGYSTKAACLQTTGTGHRRSAGGQLGEPAGLLRAVLLRHRSAVHRGAVEPGQVSVQVQLDRDRQRRQAAHPVRRQHRRALHGVSGAHRHLPVRVDGAGQDLHRAEQAGVGAGHRRGGDVLQHRRVRSGAGVAGDGVGDRPAGRQPADLGRGAGGGVAAGDLSDLHQLRRVGNGFARSGRCWPGRGEDRCWPGR